MSSEYRFIESKKKQGNANSVLEESRKSQADKPKKLSLIRHDAEGQQIRLILRLIDYFSLLVATTQSLP